MTSTPRLAIRPFFQYNPLFLKQGRVQDGRYQPPVHAPS